MAPWAMVGVMDVEKLISGVAAVALLLTGCASGVRDVSSTTDGMSQPGSSSTGDPAASPAPPESPTSALPDTVEVEVSVQGGEVTPPLRRVPVDLGRLVRLVVTVDVRDEVHVHGFDVSADATPGRPATLEFLADQQGLFEVELHLAGLQLLQLQVQ